MWGTPLDDEFAAPNRGDLRLAGRRGGGGGVTGASHLEWLPSHNHPSPPPPQSESAGYNTAVCELLVPLQ